jgi:hypothetical protein
VGQLDDVQDHADQEQQRGDREPDDQDAHGAPVLAVGRAEHLLLALPVPGEHGVLELVHRLRALTRHPVLPELGI